MAYAEIAGALRQAPGASERYKRLDALDRLLDNTFFDDIAFAFEQETLNDEYLPLIKRRPSVKYNLARIVIDESSGSLWADDEMATVACGLPNAAPNEESKRDQRNVDAIVTDCSLDAVMMELYERSAAGSGAVIVSVDDEGYPAFECVQGKFLRPIWTSTSTWTLSALERVYPVTAANVRAAGIALDDKIPDGAGYWMRIVYSATDELRYKPMPAEEYVSLGKKRDDGSTIAWTLDTAYPHRWGVVPAIYVRNLLFGATDADGRCPFEDVTDIQVEIARLLSQVGRGLRYAADPLLVRDRGDLQSTAAKIGGTRSISAFGPAADAELSGPNGETVRSPSNVLYGEAKLLEMTGSGLRQADEHVKLLREWGLEVAGAMKADAQTAKGAMSGRALDLLQQMLRLLVKRQRIAFGTRGYLPLIRIILAGCANGVLSIPDVVLANPRARMRLVWPKSDEATLAPILPEPEPVADDPSDPPAPTPTPKAKPLAA